MKYDYYPEEISRELKKVDSIRERFNTYYMDNWRKLRYGEDSDFDKLYELTDIRFQLEKIYSEGKGISHDMLFDLDYNYIEKYPTITVFINNFQNTYLNHKKELKKLSQDIKTLVDKNNVNIGAVNSMIRLYDNQIKLIENIEHIFKTLKKTDYYLKENPSILNQIKQHKKTSFVISIFVILLAIITYTDDISSKIQNIYGTYNKFLKKNNLP